MSVCEYVHFLSVCLFRVFNSCMYVNDNLSRTLMTSNFKSSRKFKSGASDHSTHIPYSRDSLQ